MKDFTFEEFLKKLDKQLEGLCGMSHEDLVDICYRDIYDDSSDIDEAVEYALEELGEADELFGSFLESYY